MLRPLGRESVQIRKASRYTQTEISLTHDITLQGQQTAGQWLWSIAARDCKSASDSPQQAVDNNVTGCSNCAEIAVRSAASELVNEVLVKSTKLLDDNGQSEHRH